MIVPSGNLKISQFGDEFVCKMAHVGVLREYEPDKESRLLYVERFDCNCMANKVDDRLVVPTFLASVGAVTYGIARNLADPKMHKDMRWSDLKKLLNDHFKPTPWTIAERFKFHRREQKPGEKVGSYVVALKELAAMCEFGSFLNESLRDRLVCGLRSEAVQRRLLSEKDLTWKTAQEIAQAMEMAYQEARSFGQGTTGLVKQAKPPGGDGEVHAMSKRGSYRRNRGYKSDQQKRHCFRCGDSRHMANDCRFKDAIYRKCGKRDT